MATDYKVGLGHDLGSASLTLIVPQPRSEGLQFLRRSYALSGQVYDEGCYIELLWDVLYDMPLFGYLMSLFGVNYNDPAHTIRDVTVNVPNLYGSYTLFNGIAVRPLWTADALRRNIFVRNVRVLVKDLQPTTG